MGGGNIITGAPEDLVLDGLISKVFDSEQYFFDQELGGFAMKSRGIKVKVSGSGRVLIWTKRALERAGYQAVDHQVDIQVVCKGSDSNRKWEIVTEDQTVICDSIGELTASLTELFLV